MSLPHIIQIFVLIPLFGLICPTFSFSNLSNKIHMKNSIAFLSELGSLRFQGCTFFLIQGMFSSTPISIVKWRTTFEHLSANELFAKYSGGVFNIELKINQTLNAIRRQDRLLSDSCSVIVLFLPEKVNKDIEEILSDRLEKPLLNPVTVKNRDKYFIFTEDTLVESIYNSVFISSIKFKLVLTEDKLGDVLAHRFCSYCPLGPIRTFDAYPGDISSDINTYFPDLQKNYFGSVLKSSASDKLPGLLEMEKVGEKYYAKRGVYAYALFHLVDKLNFTYDIVPSSGGGSTGHPLANGTWVGTVGDAYNGKTEFGFVAGMTFLRFPIIELCATITFEYISFAIGPPVKVFTWKAIFWPLSSDVWFGIVLCVFLSVFTGYFILYMSNIKIERKDKSWGIMSLVQYYGRSFMEQGDNLPFNLPESIRVLLGFWLLFVLVSATAYKSKMVSFMTFPVLERLPDNFDQLEKSNYDIIFHYFGSVAYNTFKTSTNPTFVNIFNRMSKEPNPLKCLKSTLRSKSACVLFGITYDELKYRNISNKFGDSPIKISPNYGFMYTPGVLHRKKAALSNNFKRIINTAMEMGLISQWQKTDLNQILKNKNMWEAANNQPDFIDSFNANSANDDVLHLPNLIGSFTILLFGIVVAIITFAGEHTTYFFRGQRKLFFDINKIFTTNNFVFKIFSSEKTLQEVPEVKISQYY